MTALSNLKVYATHPHQCSYLSDKQATTLFVDPDANVTAQLYSELADMGFRRSGPHIYRPHCETCQACIPARVPVGKFKAKRSQRKIWNRNQDLQVEAVTDIGDDEYYRLYERYIGERHVDGDMFPANYEQYASFLSDDLGVTRFYAFRKEQQLLALAVTDQMNHGLSAIYTFFDPDYPKRSLGTYAILWQIEHAKALGLDSLYLGYWIKACQKMSYKVDYKPLELYIDGRWLTLT